MARICAMIIEAHICVTILEIGGIGFMEELFECTVRFGKRSRSNPLKWVSGVEYTGNQLVINFSFDRIAIPERFARLAYDFICNYGQLDHIHYCIPL